MRKIEAVQLVSMIKVVESTGPDTGEATYYAANGDVLFRQPLSNHEVRRGIERDRVELKNQIACAFEFATEEISKEPALSSSTAFQHVLGKLRVHVLATLDGEE